MSSSPPTLQQTLTRAGTAGASQPPIRPYEPDLLVGRADASYSPFARVWLAVRRFANQPGVKVALLSFWLSLLWMAAVKPLNAPDEPAHLQAIMEVRNNNRLPEIHYNYSVDPGGRVVGAPGDPATRAYAMRLGYTDPFLLVPYESMQPPLYYIVVGLLSRLGPSDPQAVLYVGRLVAALLGAGVVYFCWAAVRQIAPRSPIWAVAVAGVVALLPQFCFNNVTAANDSMVNFMAAASFYVWFRGLRQPDYDPWLLRAGALLGLALLSKLIAVALIPGLVLVILSRALQGRPDGTSRQRSAYSLQRGGRMLAGATVATVVVCGWWFVRNILVYGEISGSEEALRFYINKNNHLNLSDPAAIQSFVNLTWESFWGVFGWFHTYLPQELFEQARVVSYVALALSGLALVLVGVRWLLTRRGVPTYSWYAVIAMIPVIGLIVVGYFRFSATVGWQSQGRYLFTLLLPLALIFTGGLHALAPGRIAKIVVLSVPLIWMGYVNMVGLLLINAGP